MADVGVTVEVNKADLRKVDRVLGAWPKQGPRVLNRAINWTSDRARVLSVRKIAEDTELKQKDLFQKGNWRRPFVQTRSSIFKLVSTIRTSGARIPLIRFKAKQVLKRQKKAEKLAEKAREKIGVSYDLGRGRETIPTAFLARVGAAYDIEKGGLIRGAEGHLGVFVRKGNKRLPIKELAGPSIRHVFSGEPDDIIDDALVLANKMLPKAVDTQLALVLRGKQLKGVG